MANERITEGFVRDHFKSDALFSSIKWEEQKSANRRIQELLKGESKGAGKGNGYPEFILSFPTNSSYIIVVECKAKVADHESESRDNAVKYAVDGALHYARALSRDFNVIAIAVSGQTKEELKVSHFYWKREAKTYADIDDTKLLGIDDYMQVFDDQFFISDFYTRDIASKARYLNEELNNYTIAEYNRCTMISAMLLALIDDYFREKYEKQESAEELGQNMIAAIERVYDDEKHMVRNKAIIIKEFSGILTEPIFVHATIKNKQTKKNEDSLATLKEFIHYLHKNVFPLVSHHNIGYDVLGRFYIEFIRYAASEQKSGLVLTPAHITELFCDLGELTVNDIVYDPCCGTGGFLVAAMLRMFKLAGNDLGLREDIRTKQLCGVELRPDIYTYACSNMRFRGDGKSNIYNGYCQHYELSIHQNHKPTVAFLNPPYDVGTAGQMEFIEHALKTLDERAHGRVVAIVQMSCATKNEADLKKVKERLLAKHHLKAVISMPDDLFYPVGVVTCIMVFEANKPNAGRKTWFGYFKDDGFEKRKHLGRIDARNRYAGQKERLLSAYLNLDEIPGLSARKEITAEDEWCAEAYLETDYSTINAADFVRTARNYAAFLFQNELTETKFLKHYTENTLVPFLNNIHRTLQVQLEVEKWRVFRLSALVNDIHKGIAYNAIDLTACGKKDYSILYITRTDENNGSKGFVINENFQNIEKGNALTVGDTTSTIYYQPNDFICGDHIVVMRAEWLNQYTGLFVTTLLAKERFRYSYGRSWKMDTLKSTLIKLPVDSHGNPDWQFMEDYIKSLPYSANL